MSVFPVTAESTVVSGGFLPQLRLPPLPRSDAKRDASPFSVVPVPIACLLNLDLPLIIHPIYHLCLVLWRHRVVMIIVYHRL